METAKEFYQRHADEQLALRKIALDYGDIKLASSHDKEAISYQSAADKAV